DEVLPLQIGQDALREGAGDARQTTEPLRSQETAIAAEVGQDRQGFGGKHVASVMRDPRYYRRATTSAKKFPGADARRPHGTQSPSRAVTVGTSGIVHANGPTLG